MICSLCCIKKRPCLNFRSIACLLNIGYPALDNFECTKTTKTGVKLSIMQIREWGTHGLNGWDSFGKVSYCFWETSCLILMGHLRGLLFNDRCSYTKGSFAGHSGLYCVVTFSQ